MNEAASVFHWHGDQPHQRARRNAGHFEKPAHVVPKANPWGLTERQAECMDAIVSHGCQKVAAARLGISVKTIEAQCSVIRSKMNSRGRLMYVLVWDRWRRESSPSLAQMEPA